MKKTSVSPPAGTVRPLKGVRVLSLALNLPGPAALLRCSQMGARCVKIEPPQPAAAVQEIGGDPMRLYSAQAYAALHTGVRVVVADLKIAKGQKAIHRELARADVLLTSFRPSALKKLGLEFKTLRALYPTLSQVAIVGAPGSLAEIPGHDLTYMAENDLITGLNLPATLYADMGGALMASEAVLQAMLCRATNGKGVYLEVALSNSAAWLALPRAWGLTTSGTVVGGGHAGYKVYPCQDGRVAVAALEPHFASRLCEAAGLNTSAADAPLAPATHRAVAAWMLGKTRAQLDSLALANDIPLCTLSNI